MFKVFDVYLLFISARNLNERSGNAFANVMRRGIDMFSAYPCTDG